MGHIRHLAWSPDGTQLLIVAGEFRIPSTPTHNPLVGPQATRLFLVNVDGTGFRAIESDPEPERFYVAGTWSPDGTQVAVIDFYRAIVVMNTDGSDRQILANVSYSDPFTGIAWHPVP